VVQGLAVPPYRPAERGAHVRLELDHKGFIRARHILDAASSAGASTQNHDTRDREIRRVAAFNAATNFLGLMGQVCQEVKCDPRARVG